MTNIDTAPKSPQKSDDNFAHKIDTAPTYLRAALLVNEMTNILDHQIYAANQIIEVYV